MRAPAVAALAGIQRRILHDQQPVTQPSRARRPPRLNAADYDRIVKRYADGDTAKAIGDDYGVHRSTILGALRSTILGALRASGIEPRNSAQAAALRRRHRQEHTA